MALIVRDYQTRICHLCSGQIKYGESYSWSRKNGRGHYHTDITSCLKSESKPSGGQTITWSSTPRPDNWVVEGTPVPIQEGTKFTPKELFELSKDNPQYLKGFHLEYNKHGPGRDPRIIEVSRIKEDKIYKSWFIYGIMIDGDSGGCPADLIYPEENAGFSLGQLPEFHGSDTYTVVKLPQKKDGEIPVIEEKKIDVDAPIKTPKDAMAVFADALAPLVQDKLKGSLDEKQIQKIVEKAVKDSMLPIVLEIKSDDKPVVKIENPHQNLEDLLYFISKRHHVYLYGPAGSGKSTSAKQVSEALSLPFGYISLNPQTPDSRLLGFIDAGGTYRPTPFYTMYRDGGIFCIDELDNASASLLTTLNSMLENGHGAFPCGLIERHKDFVLVATGNTNGRGANPMFPERRPFDIAFAERFSFLYWPYDENLEKKILLSINSEAISWFEWVTTCRKYCSTNFPKVLVSPRASFKGAMYLKDGKMKKEEIVESLIFKGLDKDTIKKILIANPLSKVK